MAVGPIVVGRTLHILRLLPVQLNAYRAAQSSMHLQNLGFASTSLVVVVFRDTELVITRSWLKVNAYEVRLCFAIPNPKSPHTTRRARTS